MKAIAQRIRFFEIKCNFWTSVFYVIIIFFLIFSIVSFKLQCIKIGYNLNRLHNDIKNETVNIQNLQLQKNRYIQRHKLYRKAKSMGLELSTADKVYYVE